jgi:phenylacetaldehyde dehydrogenase
MPPSFKVGPSLAPDTMMGPLVSTEQRDRVMGYIEQGKEGGRVRVPRRRGARGDGYFVSPPSWST